MSDRPLCKPIQKTAVNVLAQGMMAGVIAEKMIKDMKLRFPEGTIFERDGGDVINIIDKPKEDD